MKTVILVRHGETTWNREGRIQGNRDIELSSEGRVQTSRLVDHLCSLDIDSVLSSPLLRARAIAEPVSRTLGIPLIELPQLCERRFGTWEGLTLQEVAVQFPETAVAQRDSPFARPEGGESVADVLERALFVRRYVEGQSAVTTLVVAHGAFNCIFMTALLGLPVASHKDFGQANGNVSVIGLIEGSWRIELLNSTCHLGFDAGVSLS
jgi:broad specificity phosphatase PhoE